MTNTHTPDDARAIRTAAVNVADMVAGAIAVSAYLPANYHVSGAQCVAKSVGKTSIVVNECTVYISGYDNCGWTLDDYVIPRLASGLFFARELDA